VFFLCHIFRVEDSECHWGRMRLPDDVTECASEISLGSFPW
jgi:hypothetical protein